jgi:hypothetical protein
LIPRREWTTSKFDDGELRSEVTVAAEADGLADLHFVAPDISTEKETKEVWACCIFADTLKLDDAVAAYKN